MKKLFLFIFSAFLLFSCEKIKDTGTADRINSFDKISESFADPPAKYRTVPFWVWNEKVTQQMIDEQLEDFHEKGFGGVFVHPRYGLITEYVSAEWFDLVKYAKEKAESLGMYLWLYDENSFPSGFAGGHVPAQMPQSYENGIAMRKHEMKIFEPDTLLSWIAFYERKGDGYVPVSKDKYADYSGREGQFVGIEKLFYQPSKWFGGYTYVDLIQPGVTEKFIEITMTGYEQTIGEDFGDVVPGVFTDEPNISPRSKDAIRWTSDLFEVFENTWGYSIEEHLVSLFKETGEWQKVRHNYYSVLLDLFIERWSIPWYEYTEEKNLKWTGHYWEHGWPNPVHGGDNMAMYAYHQVPGIDMLFNTMKERPDQFGNVRAVKELSSVANQFGRSRALSETYGASGYELSFHDMKRNGDWQYALGVNLMNQHLSYQSMLGDRKHDFPQTFSYHTPWWDEYKVQADYFARLSLALSSGFQVNHILVIEPTTTAWMHYIAGAENSELNEIRDDFHRFINEMEYLKLEYDLAAEKTMEDFGSVMDDRLVIGERSYSTVVIPYGLTNLDRSTLILIEEFLMEGGELISFETYPDFVDGVKTTEVKELFEEYSDQVEIMNKPRESSLPDLVVSGELEFSPLEQAEFVYFMRRQLEDGDILFLANFDQEATKKFSLKAENVEDMVELDPVTGKIYKTEFEKTSGGVLFNVELEDAGSRLYFLSDEKTDVEALEKEIWEATEEKEIFITGIRRNDPNVIVLDYNSLEFIEDGETTGELMYFYSAHDKIYRKHGFPDNPWVSSSQFKTEIVDRDTFGINSGFKAGYPVFINEGTDLSTINLVIERPGLYNVFINDIRLKPLQDQYYLDKGMGVYPAGEALKPGKNLITLIGQPFSVFHELAPVFLTGNFSVQPVEQGFEISQEIPLSLGSWKEYGLPFYPGEVTYLAEFEMESPLKAKLDLNDWSASCVTVSVNDSKEMVLWTPYEKDISKWLKEGINKVEISLNGSLKNLIGPHHNVNRKGIVTPWSFKYAPEEQPPGEEYDLMKYGLFSDPVIKK